MLGRIDPGSLPRRRACASIPAGRTRRSRRSDGSVGLDAVAAAEAVIEIANEGMAGTIRRVAVERGVDPRDFELVAFGGAGPLHAAEIAASLGMAGVIVPPHPGLASAFGTLLADRRVDRRWTHYARSDAVDVAALAARLDAMERDARAALAAEGFAGEPAVDAHAQRCATPGQNYERDVPLPPGPLDRGALGAAFAAFHALHHEVYGYSFPGETIELIHAERDGARPGRAPGAGVPAARASCRRRASCATSASAARRSRTPVFRREDAAGRRGAARPGDRRGARLDHARPARPGAARALRRDPAALRDAGRRAPGARSTP